MARCLVFRRAAIEDDLVVWVTPRESLSVWTIMPSSIFRHMTIMSLERQQSPATGAAAKMSDLSSYPRRSLAWLKVEATATVRLLKVVVTYRRNRFFWRWRWLWRRTRKQDQDVSDGSICRCKDHNHLTVRAVQTLVMLKVRCASPVSRDAWRSSTHLPTLRSPRKFGRWLPTATSD